jgi:hypothetical protein
MGVESTNGSVRIGSAARSPHNPMFSRVAHLGASGNYGGGGWLTKFMDAIKAVKDFAGKVGDWLTQFKNMGEWGGIVRQITSGVLSGARSWVNDKIPGPGPLPSFDGGGVARGRGYMLKNIVAPERTLGPRDTENFERLVKLLERGGIGGPLVNYEHVEVNDVEALTRRQRSDAMKLAAMLRLAT